jgi:hypothetical protein
LPSGSINRAPTGGDNRSAAGFSQARPLPCIALSLAEIE